jgi:hypothetical protein
MENLYSNDTVFIWLNFITAIKILYMNTILIKMGISHPCFYSDENKKVQIQHIQICKIIFGI